MNMAIYEDPNCGSTGGLSLGGTNNLDVGGTIYIPKGSIVLNGNPATITSGQLIANTIDVQNGNLNVTFTAGTTAVPILPRLAE